ncbi:MAG: hypothetical protein IKO35_04445, partial [Elusimicrobiaceae bacterium]|nr:hypothetical protein [Elusimicrobiaceae bacterium]
MNKRYIPVQLVAAGVWALLLLPSLSHAQNPEKFLEGIKQYKKVEKIKSVDYSAQIQRVANRKADALR